MTHSAYWLGAAGAVLFVGPLGCSSTPSAPSGGTQKEHSASTSGPTPLVVPGYVDTLARSHFRIGQNVHLEVSNANIERWRGSFGAFTVDPANGCAAAMLDAGSPKGPYILDVAAEEEAVEAYFVSAGLPADQIGAVQATYQGGQATPILRRNVQGVLVVESEAWALMTTSGETDAEFVFWPPLDGDVVRRAAAFKAHMSQTDWHAAYVAKLPSHVYREDGVVIHTTSFSSPTAPVAYVSYDAVLSDASDAAVRHFDENGVELQLQ